MANVRLFGRAYPHQPGKKVTSLRLRLTTRDLGPGTVFVSDVQLQPGKFNTGWVQRSEDREIQEVERFQFRNGVVHDDMTVIVMSDTPDASPARWDVRGASNTVQIGDYDFGHVSGSASVDGAKGTSTHGAGIPPHLTRRSDIDVPVKLGGGRALLTCWFRGLASTDPNISPEGED